LEHVAKKNTFAKIIVYPKSKGGKGEWSFLQKSQILQSMSKTQRNLSLHCNHRHYPRRGLGKRLPAVGVKGFDRNFSIYIYIFF